VAKDAVNTTKASLESAALLTFPYLVDALGVSALGLLVPTSLSLGGRFIGQLILLVFLAVFVTSRLLALTTSPWFAGSRLRFEQRVLATGVATVILVTGVVGLATLASSAALRFQHSTQFLQLLSALDIAWAAATVMVAAYWLWGRVAALIGGAAVGVLCVATIARYLKEVGFTTRGGWRLRASDLWTYVLPFDTAVALIAIGLLFFAWRRKSAVG